VCCPICGGPSSRFERLDTAAIAAAAVEEGDAGETGFDGYKLGWTLEARGVLHQLPAGYLRRRVKAIVEKHARTRRLPAITREVVEPYVLPELASLDGDAAPHRAPIGAQAAAETPTRRLRWSTEAESRLERIPEGFLRNLAREQVERLALAVDAEIVEILHVEAGIAEARSHMRAALDQDGSPASAGNGGCPVTGHGGQADVGTPISGGCPAVQLNEVTAGFVESVGRKVANGRPQSPLSEEVGRGSADVVEE
jgi:hypothetical protein